MTDDDVDRCDYGECESVPVFERVPVGATLRLGYCYAHDPLKHRQVAPYFRQAVDTEADQ